MKRTRYCSKQQPGSVRQSFKLDGATTSNGFDVLRDLVEKRRQSVDQCGADLFVELLMLAVKYFIVPLQHCLEQEVSKLMRNGNLTLESQTSLVTSLARS